jgi:hypothetical protein
LRRRAAFVVGDLPIDSDSILGDVRVPVLLADIGELLVDPAADGATDHGPYLMANCV